MFFFPFVDFFSKFCFIKINPMESKRRSFLKNSSILASSILLGGSFESVKAFSKNMNSSDQRLSILHTAGLSGHITAAAGPFGGFKKVDQIFLRRNNSALRIDSGNFLKATGEEKAHFEIIKMMNRMGYLATTVGKNELSMGQEQLAAILPAMDFKLVNCNYDFSHTTLSSGIKSYVIFNFGKVKVGVTGVGNCDAMAGVRVREPFQAVNETARKLKRELQCDLVICLTQFNRNLKKYNDKNLAEASKYVDLIIGGESGKVAKSACALKNAKKYDVILSQAGSEGKTVGELNYSFNEFNMINGLTHKYSVSGMSDYASLAQNHEVFQLLTSV